MKNDYYKESGEIEAFLIGLLNPKLGSKTYKDLKGAYQSIKLNEEGSGFLKPAQQRKEVEKLLKYFGKAIDLLIKRNPEMKSRGENLKSQLHQMTSSNDIWYLYEQVRKMK
ncbi:hypothetical protein GCM10011506_20950 [Marivirga lumbricoides]|uniref:Uncharacterized protein n=1 Tax=Marivirga lumbricoides TaxID=1046115 RepID=A0ABQ1M8A6_9BACT|nr:hypothetical protein GCM10011506_20950 [Marivirga lumbricoides]